MKKLVFLALMCSSICFSSFAQLPSSDGVKIISTATINNSPQEFVTVISIKGKALYAKPGGKFKQKIKGGEILDKNGMIKLKKKASMILLEGNATATLNKKGKHTLNNLQASSSGGDPFLGFLNNASGFGGPGDGDRPKRDTTRGHNPGKGIQLSSPLGGNIPAKSIVFKWAGESNSGFTVNIYDADDKKVFSKETKADNLSVDLSQMKEGKTYFWEVTKKGASVPISSRVAKLTIVSPETVDKAIKTAESTDGFQNESAWMKALKKGHALESKKLYYNADRIYRQAKLDFPKNDAIHAALLANGIKESKSGMVDE